ncbi:unnamed protein product [Didymodactylos carnosus]|uniref:Protein fem-1 homolog B n=1 Tax=Didymodactylos carnosus TaxID=1234261 RepID=A0A814W1J9_9BILA|nr:unnamed protein product [Didymodactylos carnosus]CAF1226630.1 unnamed protein product [Didymodactylos carnosus]CAF3960531.1 unnamed protein product [Didymodactylos carnosus]CAF4034693.1 unnamed protein product [Didymodactylos carnosus]
MTYSNGSRYQGYWKHGCLYVNHINISQLIDEMRSFNNEIDDTGSLYQRSVKIRKLKYYIYIQIIDSEVHYSQLCTVLLTVLDWLQPEQGNLFINEFIPHTAYQWNILLVAAKNGFVNVVELLLRKFNVNTEIEGIMEYDNQLVPGATAIWCAAASDHLNIVKLLIFHGANINHCTRSKSTPLRAACFFNRLEIVKCLIENGADVEQVSLEKNTCLMISSYRGHLDVCHYLLSKAVDVNARDLEGATPLYYACKKDHFEIVKLLVDNGAINSINSKGETPLKIAALAPQSTIVEYLVNLPDYCSVIERIEALELLSTSFCMYSDATYDIARTYNYLSQAMHLRYVDQHEPFLKIILPSPAIYENYTECETLKELEQIQTMID